MAIIIPDMEWLTARGINRISAEFGQLYYNDSVPPEVFHQLRPSRRRVSIIDSIKTSFSSQNTISTAVVPLQ